MLLDQQRYQCLMQERITKLQGMLRDELTELMDRVKQSNQEALQNSNLSPHSEKYKKYEKTLRDRIVISENFISQVADTHFKMLSDEEFLMLTT